MQNDAGKLYAYELPVCKIMHFWGAKHHVQRLNITFMDKLSNSLG